MSPRTEPYPCADGCGTMLVPTGKRGQPRQRCVPCATAREARLKAEAREPGVPGQLHAAPSSVDPRPCRCGGDYMHRPLEWSHVCPKPGPPTPRVATPGSDG